jgi:phosphatidylglycerophosphate synthase
MATFTAPEPAVGLPASKHIIPAVILISDAAAAALRIASLSLLDRLIVAIHRGGAGPITLVARSPLPPLKRARALKIPFEVAPEVPSFSGPVLLASSDFLVQAADIRRCLQAGGRLLTADGVPLSLGVASSAHEQVDAMLIGLPEVRCEGVAARVTSAEEARHAEKKLWASLTSSSDGLVDKVFNRPCGRPLSRLLIYTPITPNAVSILSVLIGVLAAAFFALGDHASAIFAALLFQLSAIIDCVDGDLARVVFKESPLGKWIDLVGDQVVHVSIFAGIALGIYRAESSTLVLWLGAAAVVGAILSFGVVLRGMRRASQSGPLKKLIDSATNRDFSVLVMVLAFIQELDIFMWLSAIGSHFFWIAALALQLPFRSARAQ